ncbi:hypothetical protein EV424DRAFT_108031 [Suillus variegatus]|nr:hypothetical protein EV424DRAFT_108031 [Suillus variegatus]
MHIWSYLTIPALSTYAAFKLGLTDPGPGTIVAPWIISHASWLVSTNRICFNPVFSLSRFSIGGTGNGRFEFFPLCGTKRNTRARDAVTSSAT